MRERLGLLRERFYLLAPPLLILLAVRAWGMRPPCLPGWPDSCSHC